MTKDVQFSTLRYEVDRLFDTLVHAAWGSAPERAAWRPAVDVVEEEDRYRIELDLPGVRPADLHIGGEGKNLRVEGVRQRSQGSARKHCHVGERACGRFSRSFRLPDDADIGAMRANLQDGVLTLEVPRRRNQP